jgi:Helix-turn-helix domain
MRFRSSTGKLAGSHETGQNSKPVDSLFNDGSTFEVGRNCGDPEAAEYLGIATSTLYRYACQHKIESRKLCGRLEYRLSALDKFKDLHNRPATRWPSPGRIIPSALGSGK